MEEIQRLLQEMRDMLKEVGTGFKPKETDTMAEARSDDEEATTQKREVVEETDTMAAARGSDGQSQQKEFACSEGRRRTDEAMCRLRRSVDVKRSIARNSRRIGTQWRTGVSQPWCGSRDASNQKREDRMSFVFGECFGGSRWRSANERFVWDHSGAGREGGGQEGDGELGGQGLEACRTNERCAEGCGRRWALIEAITEEAHASWSHDGAGREWQRWKGA